MYVEIDPALRLCPSQGKSEFEARFVDEIYKAKKKLWLLEAEANDGKKKALRSYLSVINYRRRASSKAMPR